MTRRLPPVVSRSFCPLTRSGLFGGESAARFLPTHYIDNALMSSRRHLHMMSPDTMRSGMNRTVVNTRFGQEARSLSQAGDNVAKTS